MDNAGHSAPFATCFPLSSEHQKEGSSSNRARKTQIPQLPTLTLSNYLHSHYLHSVFPLKILFVYLPQQSLNHARMNLLLIHSLFSSQQYCMDGYVSFKRTGLQFGVILILGG